MRLSRKSRAENRVRELPDGARQSPYPFEVHSASSVLNSLVGTTAGGRYTAQGFQPVEALPVRAV